MELKTFDTILTGLCDSFDELIKPRKISRSNTNVIFLVFKAISKGLEVINNVCVVLSNKFDPANCSVDDLESVADIVGTERLAGSASGLHVNITNNGQAEATLKAGIYNYAFDDDTIFEFEVTEDVVIGAGSYISLIAMTQKVGKFHVTAQTDISISSVQPIPEDIQFSCTDNTPLLGVEAETDLAFRQRILTDTSRQNAFVELENTIKNLPYIFDCKIKFNDTNAEIDYDGYTIPPFTAIIFFAGEVKSELATKVAEKIICPTLQTVDSIVVYYENDIFADGKHPVYLTPFATTEYGIEVIYKINNTYANDYDVQAQIRTALFNNFVSEKHEDYVKEEDVYNVIKTLDISGIDVLGINLKYNGSNVNYIEVPISRIPQLTSVIFTME